MNMKYLNQFSEFSENFIFGKYLESSIVLTPD